MPTVTVTRIMDAPPEAVWASWAAFGAVDRFHPGIAASRLLPGSAASGVGATRQCDLKTGGKAYLRERIVSQRENERMVVDIYDGTVPLKRAQATLDLEPAGPDRTHVAMTMTFTPGMGPFGWIMAPMMKRQFRAMLIRVLEGNDAYVTKGKTVARR
jgi:uncharacterized protein YndB with AHSA1/START domain